MERKDPGGQKLSRTASAGLDESLSASMDDERTDLTAQLLLRSPD